MIDLQEREDLKPICPHCKKELGSLNFQILSAFLGKRYIYFCSQCQSVLGISHRKGFWMG